MKPSLHGNILQWQVDTINLYPATDGNDQTKQPIVNPDQKDRCFQTFSQTDACFNIYANVDHCFKLEKWSVSDPNNPEPPTSDPLPKPDDIDMDAEFGMTGIRGIHITDSYLFLFIFNGIPAETGLYQFSYTKGTDPNDPGQKFGIYTVDEQLAFKSMDDSLFIDVQGTDVDDRIIVRYHYKVHFIEVSTMNTLGVLDLISVIEDETTSGVTTPDAQRVWRGVNIENYIDSIPSGLLAWSPENPEADTASFKAGILVSLHYLSGKLYVVREWHTIDWYGEDAYEYDRYKELSKTNFEYLNISEDGVYVVIPHGYQGSTGFYWIRTWEINGKNSAPVNSVSITNNRGCHAIVDDFLYYVKQYPGNYSILETLDMRYNG